MPHPHWRGTSRLWSPPSLLVRTPERAFFTARALFTALLVINECMDGSLTTP